MVGYALHYAFIRFVGHVGWCTVFDRSLQADKVISAQVSVVRDSLAFSETELMRDVQSFQCTGFEFWVCPCATPLDKVLSATVGLPPQFVHMLALSRFQHEVHL